ncbi:MAG: hypothetical protein ABID67_01700 [Candidatus Nealsonbacteria bacterium]
MRTYSFNNKGNILISLVIGFIATSLIFGSLYYYFKQNPKPSELIQEQVEIQEEIVFLEEKQSSVENIIPPKETDQNEECQNECSQIGLRNCSGDGYQTCESYNTDSCLEWSSITACPIDNICQNGDCIQQKSSVALVIDEATYNVLSNEIATFKLDIERDSNFDVFILYKNWSKADEIRDELIKLFQNEGLEGAILIGNIPITYHRTEYQGKVYPESPSDYYYQKLNDKDWTNETVNTITQSIDQKSAYSRTIWTSRLMSPGNDSSKKIDLLRDYFDRNHKYRLGQLSYDGMLFAESIAQVDNIQDLNDKVNNIASYTNLYKQSSKVENTYAIDSGERKDGILEKITQNYEIMSFNVHGTAQSQWVGGDHYITKEDIIKNPPGSLFVSLESCSNGDISDSEYIAGWYLFSGKSLLVKANSAVTFFIDQDKLESLKEYKLIAAGMNFGDMYKNSPNGQQSMLLGDPTLQIREKNIVNGPKLLVMDENIINLGDKNINQVKEREILKTVRIKNNGGSVLKLSNYNLRYSWLDRSLNEGTSYPAGSIGFRLTDKYIVPPATEISILPGEIKNIYVYIQGINSIIPGIFQILSTYITNDPLNPYLKMELNLTWYK